ncbi:S-layer homology domain-containing protein [Acidaminobacter hydrogenoformans]|uniref:S-layer homology domain-containing protein n=1 Tax=Acidaminobacter hydrogenoformans DSM 2784 TaxID=1120920 RepID=A0A1G5S5G2_9FIRM|nr:S-layer homology domain-containing protein [Acidaminobacter hydrogenoformans]SCZ81387.1 S-layer homology domain-containing protein [Acidaminobacter hydrogenoformans DSM 2784]
MLSNVQPLVSLPLGSFKLNLHTVGAYYYNEATGTWEYVRSRVVGDRLVFSAPHLSTYGVLQKNVVFMDMTQHWAKTVIEELAVKGIVSGRALTEYEPNGTITRAEFATILVQALQLKGDVKVTFNDVYASDWYYEYVNVAALHGLVSGVGGGKFAPNENITRQDMAIMIVKAYEKLLGTSVKGVPVEIKDLPMVSAYAKDRVLAARFNQLIGGYPDGTFKPMNNATRAEAGQMVGNLISKQ